MYVLVIEVDTLITTIKCMLQEKMGDGVVHILMSGSRAIWQSTLDVDIFAKDTICL